MQAQRTGAPLTRAIASALSSSSRVLIIGCQHLPGSFFDSVAKQSATTSEERDLLAYEMVGDHVGFHGTEPITQII